MGSHVKEALMLIAVTAITGLGAMTIANASDIKVLFNDAGHISKQLDSIEAKLDAVLGVPHAAGDKR